MSAAAASARAVSRPVMPTRAPNRASPTAVALPIPPVAPVTRTVLPAITGAPALTVSSSIAAFTWLSFGSHRGQDAVVRLHDLHPNHQQVHDHRDFRDGGRRD